jgi:multidrug efflux pump subunit AcrA (membrane-fusion protein)
MKALLFLAASIAVSPAAETTAEAVPFVIERSFTATLLPVDPAPLVLEPRRWTDFVIERIAPHGAVVEKGAVLVKFEREELDRKRTDLRRALKSGALALANQELALTKLEEETRMKLEAARRTARIATEELEYFTATGRQAAEDEAANGLENAGQRLEATREELKQLRLMYEADDLTEQTEEIILKRQEYAVKSAELGFRLAGLSTRRTLEVMIPRQAEELATAVRATAIEREKAEKNLPRTLEIARLEVEGAKEALARETDALAELDQDALLMEITADEDGIFYHGSLGEGRWIPGELAKSLVQGGKVPTDKPFATLVSADAPLVLTGHVDEATARGLEKELRGIATIAGREELELAATVAERAALPETDGRYRIDLAARLPDDPRLLAGMTAECRFVLHRNESVIVLPLKALQLADGGKWTVKVKQADGKSTPREITRGRIDGERVEILSGLDQDQVVVLPD